MVYGRISREQSDVFPEGTKIILEETTPSSTRSNCDYVTFSEVLIWMAMRASFPEINEQKDLAAIMFTSGSTGRPRGVMVSHRNLTARLLRSCKIWPDGAGSNHGRSPV